MKYLLFFAALAAFGQNPAVTGGSVSFGPSHSQVQIEFTTTGWTGAGESNSLRVRVTYPGTCTSGSGGAVIGDQTATIASTSYVAVGGLTPGATSYICPEISNDGSTWFGGYAIPVTTLPLPAVHPVPPAPPKQFDTSYPDTGTGLTTCPTLSSTNYCIVQAASDCSDWISDWQTAQSQRGTHGTIIELPTVASGAVCTIPASLYNIPEFLPNDPDVKTFTSSAVDLTHYTFTLPGSVNEGQVIRFGGNMYGGNLPGGSGCCDGNDPNHRQSGPITSGVPYYAHCYTTTGTGNPCPSNVIQLYWCPTLQDGTTPVCTFAQGTLVTFNTNTSGTIAYVTEPRTPYQVVIRTSTPDSQFVPEGVRVQGPMITDGITPDLYPSPPTQWVPLMANIQVPTAFLNFNPAKAALLLGCANCNINDMIANVRFVGIEFSHAPDPYAFISSNPNPWQAWFEIPQESEGIGFDRCYFVNDPTPVREGNALIWNGMNQYFLDSYFNDMNYWFGEYAALGVTGTIGNKSYTMASGTAAFGAGSGSLTSQLTVSWTGTPSPNTDLTIFNYFSMPWYGSSSPNILNIACPPGLACSASGDSNVHIVATSTQGTESITYPTANPVFPPTGSPSGGYGDDNYFVDIVFSTSASCSSPQSMWTAITDPGNYGYYNTYPSGVEVGQTVYSDVAGYACGIKYYGTANDTGTVVAGIWSASGTLLQSANFSSGLPTGWRTVTFGTPQPMSANTPYVIGYHSNTGFYATNASWWQNRDQVSGDLYSLANYQPSNGACDRTDNWPRAADGVDDGGSAPAGGQIACVTIDTNGNLASDHGADLVDSGFQPEGSQVMVGGIGPGGYKVQGLAMIGSGNIWHHDDSGYNFDWGRYDYTYYRNYWHMPAFTWWLGPYSDGMRYFSRHALEWKMGNRISVIGNIFNRWYEDSTPTLEDVEWSAKYTSPDSTRAPLSDVLFEYNTMMHGPGGLLMTSSQENAAAQGNQPPPPARFLIKNNLLYDINGVYCNNWTCPGAGWFAFGPGGEDEVLDHNTILLTGTSGTNTKPVSLYLNDMPFEGFAFTNNFVVGTNSWFSVSPQLAPTDGCISQPNGVAILACKATPSFVWSGNVFLAVGTDPGTLQGAWGGQISNNYWATQSSSVGWFNFNPSNPTAGGDFHLKSNYCSGCSGSGVGPATDGLDVGANIDQLEAAQGKVIAIGVSGRTSTTATITVDQPDSGTCYLDVSTSDSTVTTSFTRYSQSCTPGPVNFNLTGLTPGQIYYWRYDGEVQQPYGQFRTTQ